MRGTGRAVVDELARGGSSPDRVREHLTPLRPREQMIQPTRQYGQLLGPLGELPSVTSTDMTEQRSHDLPL